jgi:hypothetical protein
MKTLSLFLLVTVTSSAALAQKDFRPGYIVRDGDTLKGLVQYRSKHNSEAAIFKSTRKGETISHKPEEVSAYGFIGDKQYEAIDIDTSAKTKIIFAQVLNRGEADLLYIDKKFFLIKDDKLSTFERKADVVVTTKSNVGENVSKFKYDTKYIQILNMAISDCGMTANSLKFSRSRISDVVDEYNRCKNNVKPLMITTPRISFGGSLSGGLIQGTLTLKPNSRIKSELMPFVEGTLEVRFPRFMDKFSLNVGLQATKMDYVVSSGSGSSSTPVVTVTGRYNKIPLSFKYSLGAINNSLYLRAGTCVGLPKDVQFQSNAFARVEELRKPVGYLAGIGYDRKVLGRLRVFGEIKLEYTRWYEETDNSRVSSGLVEIEEVFTTKTLSFTLGVGI